MSVNSIHKQRMKSTSKISDPEQIPVAMAQVFQDAQTSVSAHRKLVIILTSIQAKAIELDYEEGFNLKFCKLMNKVLPLKKGESVGDKIVKFCSVFISTIQKNEEAAKLENEKEKEKDEDKNYSSDEEDGPASRFVDYLLRHLLRGIQAKDKNVRFRIVQLLAHIMNDIGEIDDELYQVMIWSLQKRLFDKEPNIRIQAILCMSRFQSVELDNPEEVSEATQRLLIAIQNDDSAEVRRAALLNLEKTSITKPFLLERARDSNSINRRLVYSRIMKEVGDFRNIEYELREKLLTWGLRDREEAVQSAAIKMFTHNWLDTVNNDLIELLERLHVIDSEIAERAMKLFFKTRQDKIAKINITSEMWNALSAEVSFLIRTLYDHCIEYNLLDVIDQFYPEAAELSSLLGKYLKLRSELATSTKAYKEANDGNVKAEDKEQAIELDFIIQQLLLIAKDYDFSDEIGRREMLRVLRSSLTNDFLPDKLIEAGLQVLRKISINERDFCSMCAEIVTDIRDSVLDENDIDDTFHSAVSDIDEDEDEDDDEDDSQPKTKRLKTNPKQPKQPPEEIIVQCLLITQHLFELTEEPLRDNLSLTSLVDSLITPAVLNRESPVIRAMGLKCLGLCCLLDKVLAIENLYLFGICAAKGDEQLRITSVKIICDVLAVHGTSVLDVDDGVDYISLAKLFYRVLRMSDMPLLQSVTAEGLCKLFLADILTDEDLFETLVLSYFHPQNINNQALRQALTFCIPVYSFSHPSHQDRIAKIGGDCFYRLFNNENEYSGFENPVAPPSTVLQQLIHWCDPNNVVNRNQEEMNKSPAHLILAITLLEAVEQNTPKNIKKTIIVNLSKLSITSHIELKVLKGLQNSIADTKTCLFETNKDSTSFKLDVTTSKAFDKFSDTVDKLIEEAELSEVEHTNTTANSNISRADRSRNSSQVPEDKIKEDTPEIKERIESEIDTNNILKDEDILEDDGPLAAEISDNSAPHDEHIRDVDEEMDDVEEIDEKIESDEIVPQGDDEEGFDLDDDSLAAISDVEEESAVNEKEANSEKDSDNDGIQKDEFGRRLSEEEIKRNKALIEIDEILESEESEDEIQGLISTKLKTPKRKSAKNVIEDEDDYILEIDETDMIPKERPTRNRTKPETKDKSISVVDEDLDSSIINDEESGEEESDDYAAEESDYEEDVTMD